MPLDIAAVRARRPQNEFHYWASLPSTMPEAARLANSGALHGTVVIADEQTAGVGRLGRSWISQSEAGIYCSVLLRLTLPPSGIAIASLLLGLATADAIQRATNLSCDLRWPNDVLIGEKKTAGILPQLVDGCVVAGIGINVNQLRFDTGLRTPATSLRLESSGRLQSREDLLVELLDSLDSCCAMLAAQGHSAILRAFTSASSFVTNRRVLVEEGGWKGITQGLDENGFLLVRTPAGHLQRVTSGGVRPE
jgi:BirA family transcriptional regulator, biotin operon repressor / biotin---[acetyl-CoA-carboxylase] ligase